MENNRGDFCCILTGYTKEMYELFNLNPGFKSRIEFIINFEDFTDSELKLITKQQFKEKQINVSDDVLQKIVKTLIYKKNNIPNFGNARDVRNIVEQLLQIACLKEDYNKDIIFADINKYMSENMIVEKRIKKYPPINFGKLQTFYKEYYKDYTFKTNIEYIKESLLQIVQTYDDCNVSTAGFIIHPSGYALTIGIDSKECISSECVRHIKDRNDQLIEVYADIRLCNSISGVSLIKITNDGDFCSYSPLIENEENYLYSERKVVIIGPTKSGAITTLRNQYALKNYIIEKVDNDVFTIKNDPEFDNYNTHDVKFITGCPVIDYETGVVLGILSNEDEKVISYKKLIEMIKKMQK